MWGLVADGYLDADRVDDISLADADAATRAIRGLACYRKDHPPPKR